MTKHSDKDVAALQKDYDAVLGAHIGESIAASEKASKLTLREAFDQVCEIATAQRLSQVQHEEAVARVAEIRAKVGS